MQLVTEVKYSTYWIRIGYVIVHKSSQYSIVRRFVFVGQ